jgi:translation initiation factor 1
MGKRDKTPAAPPPAAPGPFNAAFAGLAARIPPAPARALPVSGPAATPAPPPTPAQRERPGPARAVVRMERSGRGGKVVTVVEKLGLAPRELERWLGELKRSLGCGGLVEGDALVLQGDNRDRVGALLEARGVRKVTVA